MSTTENITLDKELLAAKVREFIDAENAHDKPRWLGLFAENALHEPAGRRYQGHEEIGGNWDNFQKVGLRLWLEDPVLVRDNEAMAVLHCRINARPNEFLVVDHFIFDEDAKIIHLRNFT